MPSTTVRRRAALPVSRPAIVLAFAALLLAAAAAIQRVVPSAQAVSPNVVISQVYGGGGNSGATYKNDFIELFNRGASAQSLNGWSVQYASATGTTWTPTNLTNITLQPGQYYLVQEAVGAGGTTNLPTPDATGAIAMSATAGKVALVNTTTALSGACPSGASIIDFIGFGTTANCFEGTGPAPAPSNTTGDLRALGGCTDTDQNATDFSAVAPTPRNTTSTFNVCGAATPTPTPSLSINDVSLAEGDAGTTNFVFTVSLSQPANAGGVSFTVNTADGTATAPSDYTAIVNGAGSIPEGSSSTQVTVSVNGDTTVEPNETFFVNISNVTGAGTTDTQGQGTITNDDVTLTKIHDIQGAGTTSPVAGQSVTTRGIVTAVKTGSGFFIQEPDATVDADPNTSEGVFVFTGSTIPAAAVVGNNVQVAGTVQEFIPSADPNQHPATEIAGSPTASVLSSGNTLPAPVTITAADTLVNNLDNLERYEGMRVTVPSLTVVAPTQGTITESSATVSSNGVFYGVVTGVARPFREPGVNASDPLPPGSPANVPRFDENPERLRVDSDAQPGTTALNVSFGSVITNVTGPLDYSFRTYTILPDTTLTATNGGATPAPTPTSTEFTVASFNMERFFDTVADGESGAPTLTSTAFNKRLNKASLIIRTVQRYPDVIGVEEMENLSTLQQVAAKVNSDAQTIDGLPDPNYVAYLSEGSDVGGIDVGFLVKESRVTTVSVTQIELAGCNHSTGAGCYSYTNPNTGAQELLNDRPPLVLQATINRPALYGGGAIPFTVIVNHLRSLSGIDDDVTANGTGTTGSRVRAKRKAQAEFLANYIQSRQTADPNEKIITVGDMNAFRINDGYVDVIGTVLGTPSPDDQTVVPGDGADLVNPDQTDLVDTLSPDQRYSYSFDGNAQVLDHVIVNPNALAILTRFAYARDDADQPVKDYEDGNIPDRISDHDQPVAYFNLAPQAQAGQFVISEFRFGAAAPAPPLAPSLVKSSPARARLSAKSVNLNALDPAQDEFIEFYNNTNAPLVVSTTDGSAGWSLVAADGTVRFTIPNGKIIPAHGHFLATNSNGYSLNGYPSGNDGASLTTAQGDISYTLDIPDESGVAVFRTANPSNFTADNRLDAVGAASAPDLYREGTGLASTGNGGSTQSSYLRNLRSGSPVDTNDNGADFIYVSPEGTIRLGAPGPENLTSPINRTDVIKASLINPCVPSSSAPNRDRVFGLYSDTLSSTGDYALGYLDIRRKFTNTTSQTVTRLRFRVVDITTAPQSLGNGTADLRVLGSPTVTGLSTCTGTTSVQGLTLETPPSQPNGGGYNSTVAAGTIFLGGSGVAPTASIDVNFRLGVAQSGSFRFFIIVEALP